MADDPPVIPAMFVARFSRWRLALGIALGCGFVALGLWLAGAIGAIDTPAPIMGYPCAAVFAAFVAIGVSRLGVSGAAVRIDADGVWVWRRGGGVRVAWHAIVRAEEVQVHRQRFLCLWVDDPAAIRGRMSANAAMGFGDISLGVQATDRTFAELRDAFAAWYDVLVQRRGMTPRL